MSSIIDALKKTQSAIDKKPYPDHMIYGDIQIPNRGTQNIQSHTSLLGQKKIPRFSTLKFKNLFSFLKRRHVIGLATCLFICVGIWLGYRYEHQIASEVTQITNNITNSIKKHTQATPVITTDSFPKIKFILNGTIRSGSKRDAMINNHLYRVGDRINDYKILEIHYDQVTLLDTETKKTTVLTTDLS